MLQLLCCVAFLGGASCGLFERTVSVQIQTRAQIQIPSFRRTHSLLGFDVQRLGCFNRHGSLNFHEQERKHDHPKREAEMRFSS